MNIIFILSKTYQIKISLHNIKESNRENIQAFKRKKFISVSYLGTSKGFVLPGPFKICRSRISAV